MLPFTILLDIPGFGETLSPSLSLPAQFDPKQRRTFLKRTKYPSVRLNDLFIGSAINVFARQLVIKAFADELTKQKITQKAEK